jgi:hypothetical protein
LLALEQSLGKQQIPHGLKAVRDDNSKLLDIACAAGNNVKHREPPEL